MGLIICFACGRQRQVSPIKRGGKYKCTNCGAKCVRVIRSRLHGGIISWADKEGISADEAKHQTYAALRGIAERRNYKKGWVARRFKEIFGRWPNGEGAESTAPASHDLLEWDRSERGKYRRQKKAEELRLVQLRGGVIGGGDISARHESEMMSEEDWGVKL